MKTLKIISILSFVLIIAGGSSAKSKNTLIDNSKQVNRAIIRYEVYINIEKDVNFCNTYLVQISDENGNPVAHPQVYIPGVNKYVFTETSPVKAKLRVASFEVLTNFEVMGCPINIITKPDIKTGPFHPFETYYFNLYPVVLREVIKE
jgi:hypothetical protein